MHTGTIIFVTLDYIGIVLSLFLILLYTRYSTNYTLATFCVVTILNTINETFLVFKYGDSLQIEAWYTPACTFGAVMSQVLPVILIYLASCMSFNLWVTIVKQKSRAESYLFKYYLLISLGIPILAVSIAMILLRNEQDFTAYPRIFYCTFTDNSVTFYTFYLVSILGALPGICLGIHATFCLFRHRFRFRASFPGNNGGINMAKCVRLAIFCLTFSLIVALTTLSTTVDELTGNTNPRPGLDNDPEGSDVVPAEFGDYIGALIAIALFATFGTSRQAFRLIMPCLFSDTDSIRGLDHHQEMQGMTSVNNNSGSMTAGSQGDLETGEEGSRGGGETGSPALTGEDDLVASVIYRHPGILHLKSTSKPDLEPSPLPALAATRQQEQQQQQQQQQQQHSVSTTPAYSPLPTPIATSPSPISSLQLTPAEATLTDHIYENWTR